MAMIPINIRTRTTPCRVRGPWPRRGRGYPSGSSAGRWRLCRHSYPSAAISRDDLGIRSANMDIYAPPTALVDNAR